MGVGGAFLELIFHRNFFTSCVRRAPSRVECGDRGRPPEVGVGTEAGRQRGVHQKGVRVGPQSSDSEHVPHLVECEGPEIAALLYWTQIVGIERHEAEHGQMRTGSYLAESGLSEGSSRTV